MSPWALYFLGRLSFDAHGFVNIGEVDRLAGLVDRAYSGVTSGVYGYLLRVLQMSWEGP